MTAGTLIAEVMLPGGSGGDVPCAAACGAVAAYDAYAVGVVAGQLDFVNIVVQYPCKQFIRQDSRGIRPSIFLRPGTDKAVGFCNPLELLIVVCAAPATVLEVGNLLVVLVAHLMEQGSNGVLNGSVQCTRSYVYLFAPLPLHAPCVIEGVVSIGSRGRLDGDNGSVKLSVKEVVIQLVVQLFEVAR